MSDKYDRAITVFSPDGHLFQVEYAQEAVKKGATAEKLSECGASSLTITIGELQVGIRGSNCVVLAVEKKAVAKLQVDRTVQKIALLDDHVAVAFAGLTADARILINRARVECQSHRLTVEDPVTVEYITRHIAHIKQKYTQSTGRRPFGLSMLIVGFDLDSRPHLYQTDPAGTYHEWTADAIGRGAKSVREYLEKEYTHAAVKTEDGAIRMALKALMEVVQSGAKNMDLAVMRRSQKERDEDEVGPNVEFELIKTAQVEALIKEVEQEREEEAEKKKQKKKKKGTAESSASSS